MFAKKRVLPHLLTVVQLMEEAKRHGAANVAANRKSRAQLFREKGDEKEAEHLEAEADHVLSNT